MGRSFGPRSPVRPCASWTVATPWRANPFTTSGSARRILVYTTFMAATLKAAGGPFSHPPPPGGEIEIPARGKKKIGGGAGRGKGESTGGAGIIKKKKT